MQTSFIEPPNITAVLFMCPTHQELQGSCFGRMCSTSSPAKPPARCQRKSSTLHWSSKTQQKPVSQPIVQSGWSKTGRSVHHSVCLIKNLSVNPSLNLADQKPVSHSIIQSVWSKTCQSTHQSAWLIKNLSINPSFSLFDQKPGSHCIDESSWSKTCQSTHQSTWLIKDLSVNPSFSLFDQKLVSQLIQSCWSRTSQSLHHSI